MILGASPRQAAPGDWFTWHSWGTYLDRTCWRDWAVKLAGQRLTQTARAPEGNTSDTRVNLLPLNHPWFQTKGQGTMDFTPLITHRSTENRKCASLWGQADFLSSLKQIAVKANIKALERRCGGDAYFVCGNILISLFTRLHLQVNVKCLAGLNMCSFELIFSSSCSQLAYLFLKSPHFITSPQHDAATTVFYHLIVKFMYMAHFSDKAKDNIVNNYETRNKH